jgi:hypothetical protein
MKLIKNVKHTIDLGEKPGRSTFGPLIRGRQHFPAASLFNQTE